ncbi:hypothetical protein [Nocardioides sp.]|uniref:hypothetical protein n=1 Tax=Nocardioides sp. TaxID=35761 RepID=UPI0031FE6CC7|nr:hypothetical protein [Nocardioides sp.]
MTTNGPATITGVSGGVDGLAATYDQVLALATSYDAAGNRMRAWAGSGVRAMTNGDLLESAPLSPPTFTEVEAAILAATSGPDGVLVESVGWETDAILLRVTVRSFQATDELVHATFEVLDHAVGRAIGSTLPATVPVLLALGLLGVVDGDDLQRWAVEHPGLLEHAVNGSGGLLDGLGVPLTPGTPLGPATFTPDTESAAGTLAALYGPDGDATVQPRDLDVASSGSQPGSLAEVIGHLGEVSDLSGPAHPENNGTIEVQTFTDANGEVRHIVYLPGTDDLATLPWSQDGDVRDLATNLQLIAGHDNAYQQGILQAMHQAGINGDDPVLLAGHSQGGMEAAAILSQGSDFNVTNVVTAGSPTAQVDGFPAGTHVLSLEHDGDVVPLFDGEENPDSVQQVTVHFGDGGTDIADHHSFPHYVDGAAAVDASDDPSIIESLQSLVHHGFLGTGQTVTSQTFQISRDP